MYGKGGHPMMMGMYGGYGTPVGINGMQAQNMGRPMIDVGAAAAAPMPAAAPQPQSAALGTGGTQIAPSPMPQQNPYFSQVFGPVNSQGIQSTYKTFY
jgi:hypothetical protein